MQSFELERLKLSLVCFYIPLAPEDPEQVSCWMRNLQSDYEEFFFSGG